MNISEKQQKIIELLKDFCLKKLNEEYFQLAKKLLIKLTQEKEIIYKTGDPEVWTVAIIQTIGDINMIFERNSEPQITVNEINEFYGTNKSTTRKRSKIIKEIFDLDVFNPEFSTQKTKESNPLNKLVMIDGFLVPIESLPKRYQDLIKKNRDIKNESNNDTKDNNEI